MSRKEIAKILKALDEQGFEARRGGSSHWKIYADGRLIAVLSATPSDRRGLLNVIAVLRRAGFVWPPR